jgi:hypothetical protein
MDYPECDGSFEPAGSAGSDAPREGPGRSRANERKICTGFVPLIG